MSPPASLPSSTWTIPGSRVQIQAAGLEPSVYRGLLNGLLLCIPFWVGTVVLIAS